MKTFLVLFLAGTAAAFLSGCASKPGQTAGQKDKDEYVYYTPTGSNIPVRVKKSDIQTTASDSQATQDAMRDIVNRGNAEHHSN
jgi:type IV pilus biogenesis protein CpaD/CtpE